VNLYGRVFAAGYDTIIMSGPAKAVLRAYRQALLGRAAGRVIEIGGGTGANLPFHGSEVQELIRASSGPAPRTCPSRIRP
jgi:hypothetical protein